ncbi:NAD-dependent epimerase/dehydratase family protein [Micromonospora sp. NPDC002411]
MTHRSLAGRRVLVTGASGTFGRHLGTALTAAGARVVGLDLHPQPDGE